MSHLVRLIIDVFVQQSEDFRYCRDQFLKHVPYLLRDGKLYYLSGYFPEKASNGFVVAEMPSHREDIILEATQCGSGYLRSKVDAVTLAETKIGLAILEYDFDCPTSRVNLPCREVIKVGVSNEQAIPLAVLSSTCEKESDFTPPKTISYMNSRIWGCDCISVV